MTDQKIEERPRFLSLLLEELRNDVETRGIIALAPLWLVGFVAVAAWVSGRVPDAFFADAHWDISTAVYAGALAFNGLLLALSWQAFARIQASICSPGFSSFLRRKKLTAGYLFWIDYVQLTQMAAACVSAVGLVSILLDVSWVYFDRVVFALTFGLSFYAVKNAMDAMRLMHDLVWSHAEYDQMQHDAEAANVTRFPQGGRVG